MLLSPEARKCGFREGGYLWFEEDCCEQVVLRELMDKKLWTPPRIGSKTPLHLSVPLTVCFKPASRSIGHHVRNGWRGGWRGLRGQAVSGERGNCVPP